MALSGVLVLGEMDVDVVAIVLMGETCEEKGKNVGKKHESLSMVMIYLLVDKTLI